MVKLREIMLVSFQQINLFKPWIQKILILTILFFCLVFNM